jgi:drug/metabolite transporter (DMT)-like permease
MTNPTFGLFITGLATVFLAIFISAMYKRFLIPKHPDTFKQTLKFGLLGGLVGMIIFFIAWTLKKQETNTWDSPGMIGVIPMLCMLAGNYWGARITYRKKS